MAEAHERLLTEDEVALVFRRAAEIEGEDPAHRAGEFDVATLERIAVEAGLSPVAVRRAVAELRAGQLAPLDRRPGRRLAAPIPASTVVERRLAVDRDAVSRRLEQYLKAQTFRVARRHGDVTVWEPSGSLAANLVRGIDLTDRMRLRGVSGLEVCVLREGDHGQYSRVRIVVDLSRVRRNARSGTITGAAFGVSGLVAVATGFAVGLPEMGLVLPLTTGIAAGAHFGARSTNQKHVKRAVDALELLLDELENRS
jgi:hypothetical protein